MPYKDLQKAREWMAEYRKTPKHKEYIRNYATKWRDKNPEKVKENKIKESILINLRIKMEFLERLYF